MKAVFDSNILIDYLNGHVSAATELERYQFKLISIISWIEVLVGVPEGYQDRVKAFLNQFDIIDIDKNISTKAIAIRKSHKLKLPDALILATANVHSAILVTRNTKDFDPDSPFIHEPYQIYKDLRHQSSAPHPILNKLNQPPDAQRHIPTQGMTIHDGTALRLAFVSRPNYYI